MKYVLTAATLAALALGGVGCGSGKQAKDVGDAFRAKRAAAGGDHSVVDVGVHVDREAELLEVVGTPDAGGRLAHLLHRGQE
jgi:hypothetical protein